MYQNTTGEESPVEVTAPPPKPSRRRQKRMATIQNGDAPRCTPWTNEEEIALCKGRVHVSKNSVKGNTRKTDGFWTEVLDYLGKKTKQLSVEHTIWAQDSRAGDEDYFNKVLLDYEAEFGVQFTLRHYWEVLKKSPKWWEQEVPKFLNPNVAKRNKTSGSSSFNTESEDASFNLNVDARDEDKNEVQEVPRPMAGTKRKDRRRKGSDHRDHR
ncbi:zinc finger BED domain-containing protein RICESLEEPER 2-like protein [Tanacetum coccineum]|uniref:Zinc finger BED domain-containing protein RICESLEEPER 2-like protein n=1 Tax=Tanacetum coccineum TaxID=301880 RepID=A0ABQ4WSM7_9ASTR